MLGQNSQQFWGFKLFRSEAEQQKKYEVLLLFLPSHASFPNPTEITTSSYKSCSCSQHKLLENDTE